MSYVGEFSAFHGHDTPHAQHMYNMYMHMHNMYMCMYSLSSELTVTVVTA